MNKLQERLKKIGCFISYDNDVIETMLDSIKKEKEYGARPVIRTIRDNIENKITDFLIDNGYDSYAFNATVENNEIKIQ